MNIDSSGTLSGTSFKANKPDLSSKAPGTAAGVASRSASPGSSVQAAAAQLMSTHGDFDAAKVAEIRASISEGRYAVNTGRIADGLLASAQELVRNARS